MHEHSVYGPRWPARSPAAACWLVAVALVAFAPPLEAAPTVVETEPLTPAEQRERFRLPPGYEIQLVAAEPTIQKPMNLAWDARGRLWVTHSIEYPWAVPDGTAARDGLTVLGDFGPDGMARSAVRFADGLNIPIGVLPLPCADPTGRGQSAIVWSIPHIWRLTDDDGDGRADRREVLYGPFGHDDTHGNQNAFRLGPDGWIYANHGFRNHSMVRLGGEGPVVLELKSGNGYRFRPDGSAIEQVSWGQVNPFGMDIDALGNRFNADCHSRPLTMLLPGGRYPSPFGIRNDDYDDGVGPAPETTVDGHGSTGIAAVALCDTDRMPADCRGSAFIGNVVTNAIHRDRIAWRGSSPWVEKPEDFLTCEDWWFRPVDLAFGPDGSLYIADFYNCIIGHYEVDLKHPRRDRSRGRIWRVVWRGDDPPAAPPDLAGRTAAELGALLDARDETLRRLAFEQLVARGGADASVAAALQVSEGTPERRARVVQARGRLGMLDASSIAAARDDASRLVRVALVRALAADPHDSSDSPRLLEELVADPDPFVCRAVAEALAARPKLGALPALLAAGLRAAPEDRQLVHALRMAIAAAVRSGTRDGLESLAIDAAARPLLLDIVSGLPGAETAGYGLTLALAGEAAPGALVRVCGGVARYGTVEQLDAAAMLGRRVAGDDVGKAAPLVEALLDGCRQGGRQVTEAAEVERFSRRLVDAVVSGPKDRGPVDEPVLRAAFIAAQRLAVGEAMGVALAVVGDAGRPLALRRDAAATAVAIDRDRGAAALAAQLAAPTADPAVLVEFTKQLAALDLPQARDAIATALTAAPSTLQRELSLAALTDRDAAERLVGLVERGKVSARLLTDPQIARRLADVGLPDATTRIESLTAGLPRADDRVREAIRQVSQRIARGEGSADKGSAAFTRHCAACHRHRGFGGLVGPQLDGVGKRGAERLLEDILDPNRNVDEAFRTTVLQLADGRVVSGLFVRDEGVDMVLVDATGREVRVPRDDVEETTVQRLSPMPAALADQVGEEGLADLVAYLRAG